LTALEKYREATRVCPTLVEAWVRRSTASGLKREARHCARRALALGPTSARQFDLLSLAFPWKQRREVLLRGRSHFRATDSDYYSLWLDAALARWYLHEYPGYVAELRRLVTSHQRHIGRPADYYFFLLAMGCEAVGDYKRAEACYRETLRSRDQKERRRAAEHVVRARMRSGRFKAAREALDELRDTASPVARRMYSRGLAFLDGEKVAVSSKLVGEADKARNAFMAGVLALAAGDAAGARKRLLALVRSTEGNPSEWGVTFRWETAKARELLTASTAA